MIRRTSLSMGLCCIAATAWAQRPVQGGLEASHGARLHVVDLLPGGFPAVNIVFRAVDSTGSPFWELRKDQVRVLEDGNPCEVTSLFPITCPEPINISLVIDHSGSMAFDGRLFQDSAFVASLLQDTSRLRALRDTMRTPMMHARDGVLRFMGGFDPRKDAIAITGFSSSVDRQLALTPDTAALSRMVRTMEPEGNTALFDAVLAGLEQLRAARGIRVLVVLTDGMDNASRARLADVIGRARADSVPIHAIGLGDAVRAVLDSLARGSGGKAHHAEDARTLAAIYADISRDIQAYYELTYRSENLASADTTRDVDLYLSFGDAELHAGGSVELPSEVLELLARRERERRWAWAAGIAVLAAAGGAVAFRYRRGREPLVGRVWPVPADGELFVEVNGPPGMALFTHASLAMRKSLRISSGINRYDLSSWPAGHYIVTVTVAGREPEAHRFVKH